MEDAKFQILDTQVETSSGQLAVSLQVRITLPAPHITLTSTAANLAPIARGVSPSTEFIYKKVCIYLYIVQR